MEVWFRSCLPFFSWVMAVGEPAVHPSRVYFVGPGPKKNSKKHVPLFVIALGKVVFWPGLLDSWVLGGVSARFKQVKISIHIYLYLFIYIYIYIYIYHVSVKLDQGKIKHLKAPPRIRSGWFKRSEDIVFDDLFFLK